MEFARLLEWGIDKNEPAPLFGRQQRLERDPAVERKHFGSRIAGEMSSQGGGVAGVQFIGDELIAAAKQAARDGGAPRISNERALRRRVHVLVLGANGIEVRPQDVVDLVRQISAQKPPDTGLPLARALRLRAREIVDPGAGMRVDHAECGRLLLEVLYHQRQDRVLEHVGKISGVKGVSIVHA